MGMFDYIRCDYPLPDEPPIRDWQTKDLGCDMDLYVITKDGRLLHEEYDIEDQSDPTAEPGTLGSILGCATRVNKRLVEMPDFRGHVRFYSQDDTKRWWEYSALFDGGRVVNIKRVGKTGR